MPEFWDLYDRNRNLIGKTHQRGLPMAEGTYHLIVSVWTFNQRNQLLITLRSSEKELFPNYWENTAGSALSGETSRQAALRELEEETGIKAGDEEMTLLVSTVEPKQFTDNYIVRKTLAPDAIRLQEGETADYRWVTLSQFDALNRQGLVAPPVYRRFEKIRDLLEERLAQAFIR